jgi:hypothetical protein
VTARPKGSRPSLGLAGFGVSVRGRQKGGTVAHAQPFPSDAGAPAFDAGIECDPHLPLTRRVTPSLAILGRDDEFAFNHALSTVVGPA